LRTFNWNIGWVNAAPDGFERPFVGINGQWPCPALDLNVGDTIKINAYNGLGNESTAIHFHGIFQHNTAEMDGPAMVTQCPIVPGMSESSSILDSWQKLSMLTFGKPLCTNSQYVFARLVASTVVQLESY
jgi:hypothetical protein